MVPRSLKCAMMMTFSLGLAVGCSSQNNATSNSSPVGVSIMVSPASATVQTSGTVLFSATVSGSANLSVSWEVNNVLGGSTTVGTISPTGLYAAPTSVPSPGTVTITAISVADPSKTASASVSITAATSGVSVTVLPTSSGVQVGGTLQFAATVTGAANTAVSWQVNGVSGGSSIVGTISSGGLYTTPTIVPIPSTVTVTAVSAADSSKGASVSVTILPASPPPISVSVTPSSANVGVLHTQQFTATVANSSNMAVTWTVNGSIGGSSQLGTISASGLYTAPSFVPSPATVTVSATSAGDSTKGSSAQITILSPVNPSGIWSYLGPPGMTSAVLAPDPSTGQTMYAAPVTGGLYKTTNLGQNWTLILNNFTQSPYWPVIAQAGGTIYALGTASFQVSPDRGKTFSTVTSYPAALGSINGLSFAVDPRNDQSIYLLSKTALMHSTDGGSTWANLTVPPNSILSTNNAPSTLSGGLVVSASSSSSLMAASCSGFAISTNGGNTWTLQTSGLDPSYLCINQIVADSMNPNRILALGGYSGSQFPPNLRYIYLSTDGGNTWSKAGAFDTTAHLVSVQSGPGIYVTALEGLFASFDSGKTYKTLQPQTDLSNVAAAVSPVAPQDMLYQGQADLYASQDGGNTWTIAESGLHARQFGPIVSGGSSVYTASPDLWQSSDSGQSWTRRLNPYSNISIVQLDVDTQNPLHLIGLEGSGSSVMSADGGVSWTSTPYDPAMTGYFSSLYNYPQVKFGAPGTNVAYACGTFGVARLFIPAGVWAVINGAIPSGTGCNAVAIDERNPGTIYAATTVGVFKSTDGGNNWAQSLQDPGLYAAIVVDPSNSANIIASARLGSSALSERSTDGGKTWSQTSVEGPVAFSPSNPSVVYAAAQTSLLASYDSGLTWGHVASPINFLNDLVVLPSGIVLFSTYGNSVVEFTPN